MPNNYVGSIRQKKFKNHKKNSPIFQESETDTQPYGKIEKSQTVGGSCIYKIKFLLPSEVGSVFKTAT